MRIYLTVTARSFVSKIEDLGLVAVIAAPPNLPEMSEADMLIYFSLPNQAASALVELGFGLGRKAAVWVVGDGSLAYEHLDGIVHVKDVHALLVMLKALAVGALG